MKYRPEIDGLRALAVLPVLFFHAGFDFFSGGYIGVDVFFVISGFLITTILHQQIKEQRFSLYQFYARRARRLLPALALVLVVTIALSCWILLPRELKDFAESLTAVALAASNILFWIESGYFDASAELKPLLHTWSLAVEEQYYIVFPLLLLGIWRWAKTYLLHILCGLMLVSLISAEYLVRQQVSTTFYLLPFRAWELLIGAVSALILPSLYVTAEVTHHQANQTKQVQLTTKQNLLSALGLSAILYSIFYFSPETPTPSLITLIPTIGTALVLCFAQKGTWVYRLLSQKLLVGIGLISYSLYLWHQPLFALAKYRFHHVEYSVLWPMLLIGLSTALAYLSWRWIERPFREHSAPTYLSHPLTVILFSATLVIIGLIGHFSQGFKDLKLASFSAEEAQMITQLSDDPYYVSRRWHHLKELQPFSSQTQSAGLTQLKTKTNPHKIKVMLIGDSYAQDLLNAIYEAGLDQEYQFSLYHISARCGNVWTEQDIDQHLSAKDFPCLTHPRYQSAILQQRLTESDEIWLASSWRLWQVQYLPETLKKLHEFQANKVRIFGRKAFGAISFYAYQDQGPIAFNTAPMPSTHIQVNEAMKLVIPSEIFVDLSTLLCAPSSYNSNQAFEQPPPLSDISSLSKCYHRLEQGQLMSFDGKHLSQVGARYLGQKLLPLLTHLGTQQSKE